MRDGWENRGIDIGLSPKKHGILDPGGTRKSYVFFVVGNNK